MTMWIIWALHHHCHCEPEGRGNPVNQRPLPIANFLYFPVIFYLKYKLFLSILYIQNLGSPFGAGCGCANFGTASRGV